MYVDIAEIIRNGATAPEPDILRFTQDSYLFYSGEFNLIYGDTESGKTWLCLTAVVSTLNDGGKAAIVDLDHNGANSIVNRLQTLGASDDLLMDQQSFRLAEPVTALELKEVVADLGTFKPEAVVIDSLGEVLPLFRANSNNADDFTLVHSDVIKPLARAGAAVLVVDHLPKNADSRQYGPTGTAAKTRAVGGLAVKVSAERAFKPGIGGSAKLELYKDRHGGVRKQLPSSDTRPVIGTFTLADDAGQLAYRFEQAVTVALDKQAEIDRQRVNMDVATLLELQDVGQDVKSVRAVKLALGCGQPRAEAALSAFRAAQENSTESVA
jgi:hypothetical protein